MSSVHHKTAYEEVAVEQGENNKPQSSKSLIQSKFIYIAFAIVFVVILVQVIVLYCVLKPSSSTKQQLLFLDKMINSACKKSPESSKESIPSSSSNSVNLFGITVDTSPLINKIESTLTNYENGTLGRAIRFKPTDDCLTGGLIANYSSGPWAYYKVYPAKCDDRPVQQWRKVQDRLHVGSATNYPIFGSSFNLCLDCHGRGRSCDLIVHPCNNFSEHIFYIRIFPNQIDFSQNRIYFSIHNSYYSTQCLGRQYNEPHKVNVFYLQECTGKDDQSFYLQDLDLAEEIEYIKIKIISPMWSGLLGYESKKQCPVNL